MDEYLVTCWNCAGEYDALSAVWCNCDLRNPTKLCPFCMHCFCGATQEYFTKFWDGAPPLLLDEIYSLNTSAGQLGHILVSADFITIPQLVRGMAYSKAHGKRLGESLVALSYVTESQVARALEQQGGGRGRTPPATVSAGSPPTSPAPAAMPTTPEASSTAAITAASAAPSPEALKDALNNLLVVSLKKQASALYVEPSETELVVRVRVDGVLFKLKTFPLDWLGPLNLRLKKLARLDAEECRLPQTGRMVLKVGEKSFDMIVQTVPSAQGESVGLRIIDRVNLSQDLSKLGFEEADYSKFIRVVEGGFGLTILTGPLFNFAGETAYSVMNHLVLRNKKVVSLESPVMSPLNGVNQLEVMETRGFDFVQGLKTALNLSPDVVFMSNIPDGEALKVAARIASGVQVFALMDCATTFEVFDRIRSFGVNLAQPMSALKLVVSQRMIRRNCPHCIERKPITPSVAAEMGHTADEIHLTPEVASCRGCSHCNDLGYAGRKILYETLAVDDAIREVVVSGGGQEELERAAQHQGFLSLRMLHLREVARLASSPEEFARCNYPRPVLQRIYRVK